MNEIQINLNGKKVTIKKLPIGKIAKLFEVMRNLPPEIKNQFANIEKTDTDQLLNELPTMVALAMPHLANFVAIASNSEDITEEYLLEEAGFDDGIDVVNAILEVNNIAGILEKVKKTQALYQKIKPVSKETVPTAQKIG